MARPRKSALDSVLAEIQNPSEPTLQEMLKAKAAEQELSEGGAVEPPVETSVDEGEELVAPVEKLAEPPMTEDEALKRLGFNGITDFEENLAEPSPEAGEKIMKMFPGVFKDEGSEAEEAPEEADADTTSLMTDEEKKEAWDAIKKELYKDEPVEEMVCEPPVPDIVEKEVAVVTEPVKAVTIEEQYQELKLTPKEKDMVLDGRLKEILGVPKARAAVPTLVRYRQDGQLALRGVIIDIGEYELTEGWKLYKSQVDGATPEKYLLKVYELTQTEIPRMYRTVGEMRLE